MSDTSIVSAPENASNNSVDLLLTKAVEKGLPVETMDKLLGMRRELKAERAKEDFDASMAEFQGRCPIIRKTKKGGETKSGTVAYYYAPLELIVEQTKELIQQCGFSYAIQTKTEKDRVLVTCTVKHRAGHSEKSEMEVPVGAGTSIMSASQVVAAALTFAKRYAFCNAFGIMTGDEDTGARQERETKEKEEAHGKQIEQTLARLRVVANLNALKGVFASLSGELKNNPEIVALKDELKAKFSADESTNLPK